ncbi:FHA domain-containing protein [Nocardioides sp.]|uniref:FHA domain-containing protein n=1 Tax=Nocardioides sp. TaxID=35761 RepID=UPI0031FF2634|nr:Forkhead-associated protein [Nocardioides sp.]
MSGEPTPGTRTYRPGGWFAVFGERVTVLLPPSEKARVAPVWEMVDGGAGFDETLDRLISGGLRQLPGFVLVSSVDDQTKVVVRGPARATFTTADADIELEGSAVTTWVERSLTGVTAMVVTVDDPADGPDLPIDAGLVRISRFDEPPHTVPAEPEAGPDLTLEPAAEAAPVPASDHDGPTRTAGPDPHAFDHQPPGIPGQPAAPSTTARPVATLVFSSGETVDVDRVVIVGRAPEARRVTATEQPRLVSVPSPQQEISSTHLEVRPGAGADHGSAVVTDLGSTNGTVLVQPGLAPETLQAGVSVQLIPGAVLDLGDGVTIQVANP